jgi:hypothetical protein
MLVAVQLNLHIFLLVRYLEYVWLLVVVLEMVQVVEVLEV